MSTVAKKSDPTQKQGRLMLPKAELEDLLKDLEDKGHDMVTMYVQQERTSKAGNLGRDVIGSTWKADPAKTQTSKVVEEVE
jgi:hypothetical protein